MLLLSQFIIAGTCPDQTLPTGKCSQRPDGGFIPQILQMVQAPSPKEQSRAAITDSPCKEAPKGALSATDEKNLDKLVFLSYVTLYKHLHWQMSWKKVSEAFQIDLVSAAVFFLQGRCCAKNTSSPENRSQGITRLKQVFWRIQRAQSIFPASHFQLVIPLPFFPKQKCTLQPDLNQSAAVAQTQ